MLPQQMWLNKSTEDKLKKYKEETGINPNYAARVAFFKSIESGFIYDKSKELKLTGSLKLDKHTWLGKTQLVTELLLKQRYPDYSDKELQAAWAAHVENAAPSITND